VVEDFGDFLPVLMIYVLLTGLVLVPKEAMIGSPAH
jgi:hypothetical protein